MAREVELSQLDLRYEGYRMRHAALEERLLGSIAQRGIQEPLEGVDRAEGSVLLNGFKRYRCAQKLQIRRVPYPSLGADEVVAILNLLRISNNRALSLLEQAAFIDELKNTRHLSVAEVAEELSRSKSWVSMRLGLLAEMSAAVRRQLFNGAFPVYSYRYTVRQFRRMNGVRAEQVEQFVVAVSGKKLSVREIEQPAHGCFRGPESLRQEILQGNRALPLKRMREAPQSSDGCSEFERVLLGDLEITQQYRQRVQEKLAEEEGMAVKYSTLTWKLRQLGLGQNPGARCGQVPEEPGAEMQHDTTVYKLKLGEQTVKGVATILYLRYSKRRYLKFYRSFDRFRMKCFLHEALTYWGYVPRQGIIDNTNLARLHGTGAQAVIVPEMAAFAKQYGFQFRCHEKGHSDRKAGEERSFRTTETNFLPGRSFRTLEDLNQQAFRWATVRLEHRPQGKAKLIPAKAFEHERRHLTQEEEKRLRALAPEVSAYLDFALATQGGQRHAFLRRLLALSRKMTAELFVQSVQRADRYRITSLETLQRSALLYLQEGPGELPWAEVDESFRERVAYQEGSLTEPPDLSFYQDPPHPDHE